MSSKISSTYTLRCQITVPKISDEAKLLRYLEQKDNLPFEYRDMILKAIMAFWLPFAISKFETQEQLELSLLDTFSDFQKHLYLLKNHFHLQNLPINLHDSFFAPQNLQPMQSFNSYPTSSNSHKSTSNPTNPQINITDQTTKRADINQTDQQDNSSTIGSMNGFDIL